MKTTTVASNNPMNRSSCPLVLLAIPLVLACFALLPQARATCQEGCLTDRNTVFGDDALLNNTATDTTAIGFRALLSNTTGYYNTAVGSSALSKNTIGGDNTAIGERALYTNTSGGYNTAIGAAALFSNTTGDRNTATGEQALDFNTTGHDNTATGSGALISNTTGDFNTATGGVALQLNTTGNNNVAFGFQTLLHNTTGNRNTATGNYALINNTTGNANIAVGYNAGLNLTLGDNNIDIGNLGVAGEANTIRIGNIGRQTNTFIAGINGVTVPGGVGVIIDSDGHLGTVVSSERFKDAIKPMDKASEAILALKPVTFRYKHELDPKGIPQFGLVAEDVEKVNPNLVARDADGKPHTVRYEAMNAMLLNEFLKEHRKVEKLEATVAKQHRDFEAAVADLKGQIQKVSAQVDLSKPAPETVLNNR